MAVNFPSCKPSCVTGTGNQIPGAQYRFADGRCLQALSVCVGCLELNLDGSQQRMSTEAMDAHFTSCDVNRDTRYPNLPVTWTEDQGLWADTPYLWHAVPGFIGTTYPLTVCRSTHPGFCESMRLFGVDADHGCRLEQHAGLSSKGGGGFVGPGWFITVHSKTHLGVCRYLLRDAGRPSQGLAVVNDVLGLQTVKGDDTDDTWYILPVPNQGGWDLVHAASGRRLEVPPDDPASSSMVLSSALGGLTHWEIWRPHRRSALHRCHFWLPPFLADAVRPEPTSDDQYYTGVLGTMAASMSTKVVKRDGVAGTAEPQTVSVNTLEQCLTKCESGDVGCTALSMDNEGNCTIYQGWDVVAVAGDTPVEGDASVAVLPGPRGVPTQRLDRERRLLRDPRKRTGAGQGAMNTHT